MAKPVRAFFLCLTLLSAVLLNAAAEEEAPYSGYTYNRYGQSVPSPIGYRVKAVLDDAAMGTGLNNPQDIMYDAASGELYIADTGNARVAVLDGGYHLIREYSAMDGAALIHPMGVFVKPGGDIYIADDELGAVVRINREGKLIQSYTRPGSDLYEEATPYKPQKVVVDSAGRVYVLSQGAYQGLVCFYDNGAFMNFFGSSHVTVTAKVVLQKIWRMFLTREQREGLESFIPIEYGNIAIDDEDMIYAVVVANEQGDSNPIAKLNPMGINIFPNRGSVSSTDVLPEKDGIYTALDKATRVVYQFTETSGVLLTFGGYGTQSGLFQDPVAMERVGDDILVLDAQTGTITVFEPTAFGRAIHEASILYNDGQYQKSIQPWLDVLRMDNNYNMAYYGLGKAYYQLEEYEKAMDYFRQGNYKDGYSEAFKEYSLKIVRDHMGLILALIVLLFALMKGWGIYKKRRGAVGPKRRSGFFGAPVYCMAHPYRGFECVKYEGLGSVASGAAVLLVFFGASVFSYLQTGFAFNPNRIDRFNVQLLFLGSIGSFMLVYVSNLAVSSLMSDCEGKKHELFIALSYALVPAILGMIARTVLSNFVTLDMKVFLDFLSAVTIGWSAILLVMGVYHVNQLTIKKTLLNLTLTALAVVIVLVLMVLAYSLFQQIWVFFTTIYHEIMFRM
jgi:DNA-binding beta-propeller fold protein YncE